MIAVIPLLVILALSAASPLTTRQLSYQCHNRTVTIPQHCLDASNKYSYLLQKLHNLTRSTSPTQDLPQALSETIDMLQPVFSVLCADECLRLFVRCSQNDTETEAIKKLFYSQFCARAEDGTFCWVKFYQANFGGILLRSGYLYRLFQNCSTSTTSTCSTTCQQSFRDLKTSFGCCATNYFETPSSPSYNYYKKHLANCSVPVGTPCNSASALAGAAIVYLNVVLVIAAFLMTITIA